MESGENSESDNEGILQIARSLCEQLNCASLSPERLSWQQEYGHSRDRYGNPLGPPVTTHYPLFWRGVLIINPVLQDRLTIDELRPLIASSVVYYGQLISRLKRRMALLVLPVILVLAAFSLFVLTGRVIPYLLPIFIIALLVPLVLAAYSSFLWSRKFMLLADRRVAEQFGAQPLLETLRKIQRLRDSDEKEEKMAAWAWVEHWEAPSVENRIQNLETDHVSSRSSS